MKYPITIEGVMGILRKEMITLHRSDNGEEIYVDADSITLIESGVPDGSFVYIGGSDRLRQVKEAPSEVRRMVERSA
jgi:hypothetical protein